MRLQKKKSTNSQCRCPDVPTITDIKEITLEERLLESTRYWRILSVTVSFSGPSKSFGSCKCPLRLGSDLLPQRSCVMWRSLPKVPVDPSYSRGSQSPQCPHWSHCDITGDWVRFLVTCWVLTLLLGWTWRSVLSNQWRNIVLWTTDKTGSKGNTYMSPGWRCNERRKTTLNWWIYPPHIHSVVWGSGTPKDRDEVKRR